MIFYLNAIIASCNGRELKLTQTEVNFFGWKGAVILIGIILYFFVDTKLLKKKEKELLLLLIFYPRFSFHPDRD